MTQLTSQYFFLRTLTKWMFPLNSICMLYLFVMSMAALNPGYADIIKVKDGSVLVGTVKDLVDGKLNLTTSFAGDILIPADQVLEINTDTTLPIQLSDGSIINGTMRTIGPEKWEVIRQEDQTRIPVSPAQLVAINPPGPPPVKWAGKVIGSLSVTSGNSDTQGYAVEAVAFRRAEIDRITLKGGYFYQKDDGDTTRDDQFLSGKYDYFFTEQFFGYLNSRLDRDSIKELELRSTGGAGLGYQFLENDIYNLFVEGGISYVNEDFEQAQDDSSYAAGRAALHFGWWLWKDIVLFEEDAEFLMSVNDTDDWLGINENRLSWKWTDQWSLQGSVRFEYDNTPATGLKNTDVKYLLGVGYSF